MKSKKRKSDQELIAELRQFHHYEAAKRLEELSAKQLLMPEMSQSEIAAHMSKL